MPRAENRPLKLLVAMILAFCAATMLVSLAGAVIVQADTVNIFAPYWVGAMIVIGVLMAFTSRNAWSLALTLVGISAIFGGFLMWPLYPAVASAGLARQAEWRIVSFNINKNNPNINSVVEWILSQNADVVVLLEAGHGRGGVVERLTAHYPHAYSCKGAEHCSTMIFSRRPATDVWPLGTGDPDRRLGLSAVTARFDVSGRVVPVTAVHLNRPWPIGDQTAYRAELEAAVTTVGRGGIMVGDFNSAPWTFAMRRLAAAGDLHLVSGTAGTWPAASPLGDLRLPLDQVYLGRCLTSVAFATGPDLQSDHLPLVTDIATGACVG